MAEALCGQSGFYRRHEPHDHFRTSASATPLFATALGRLVVQVDDALQHPDPFDLVDVGAGDGSLLAAMLQRLPDSLAHRVRPMAVEVRDRPAALDQSIRWSSELPVAVTGLVMAHELLDNLPCDVIQRESGREHVVVVNRRGEEAMGPLASPSQQAWLDRWWPLAADGVRAEFGGERDSWWAGLIGSVSRGLALAVDYGHVRDERITDRFDAGTLTGYREGRHVLPIPDGTCDLTAHVAIDACETAGAAAGAEHSHLTRQREALRWLGVNGRLPDHGLASIDPPEYVRQLSDASSAAELIDPASLGSFWWLLQSKGMSIPVGSDALSG